MSVTSESQGYSEACVRSHEFLRRACTLTPVQSYWAGDLLVTQESILRQSEVDDMRGEAGNASTVHETPTEECEDQTVALPGQYSAEETAIRAGGAKTFEYQIPKASNPENESNWDLGVYQSLDDCGVLMDGGDVLIRADSNGQVASLCGTVVRKDVGEAKAHYLDNRNSYQDDPDNGLLVAIRTGLIHAWEVRYSPKERSLAAGLAASDDVTTAFTSALSALGMTHEDVYEFGMI